MIRETMELANKKIAFLGDSITEGTGASSVEYVYWKVIARLTGAQCYGYGIGGTRITPQQTPSPNPRWDHYFASRIEEIIPDADIIVIFGGTNDFGHGDAPFGKLDDTTDDTFCGAFHNLCKQIIFRYPKTQLVVMTPLHRCSEDEVVNNELGIRRAAPLVDYVDAIREIAGFYAIPVLDLFRVSGIQPRVEMLKELYMPDGLHPNDAGNERIAQKVIGFFKML